MIWGSLVLFVFSLVLSIRKTKENKPNKFFFIKFDIMHLTLYLGEDGINNQV